MTFTVPLQNQLQRQWLSNVPSNTSLCSGTEALNGAGHRLQFPAGATGLLFECGLRKQLHLMPHSSLFLLISVWMSSSKQLCIFAICTACKVKPSLEKSLLSYSWTNFQFQTTWFYSCPSDTLYACFIELDYCFFSFFPLNGEGWYPAHDGIDTVSLFLPKDILRT